jgi:transglutaminase-like putative cysteine protease
VIARISPTASYYTLSMAGSTVGFASLTLDTTLTTVDVTEMIDVRMPDADSVLRIVQRSRTTLDRNLSFLGAVVSRSQSGERTEVRATPVGDSALAWQSGPEGRPGRSDTLAVRHGAAAPPSALPLLVVALRSPRKGMLRKLDLVDPLRRALAQVEIAVLADSTLVIPDSAAMNPVTERWEPARYDTLRAWQISRRGDGPPVTLWVDEDGLPVRGELLPGLVAERQPFEIATDAYRREFANGALGAARSPASATLASRPPGVQSMLVRLERVAQDSSGWARAGLSGGGQRLSADSLFLSVDSAATGRSDTSPGTIEALVPGSDRAVRIQAGRVIGGETDQRRMAERLLAWVATEVAPAPNLGLPNARRALRTRKGDVSDRAILFVALARAAGLEARPVAGIVAQERGWARHAWAEVKLGGWVPADPTFGTFPAGAGYVRLLAGAPADPLYLVPLTASLAPERLTRQKTR